MSNMKFTKSHLWVRLEDDNDATVGISDYAQDELGDIVFVEQPEKGRAVKAGEALVVVESVKSASDIQSPISGKLIEINNNVVTDPAIINSNAENSGWLFKIHPTNIKELDEMMDEKSYEKYLAED